MYITIVKANVRYSKQLSQGEYKTLELGAEASILPGDDWSLCQKSLYDTLSNNLTEIWDTKPKEKPESNTESNTSSPINTNFPPPSTTNASSTISEQVSLNVSDEKISKEHWCTEHKTFFIRRELNNDVWYSHQMGFNKWCKETIK